ncbi:MAG: hydrolase [Flexilinea sp.]
MIFYTADQHFGHENIIKHCSRPYLNAEMMNKDMIDRWNSCVSNKDIVYIIGDLFFRTKENPSIILDRLPGIKHLIMGNHDKNWIKKVDIPKYFQSVEWYTMISDNQKQIALCHFPMMSWGNSGHGSYLIYGHIHNKMNADYWPLLQKMDNALNAGVDINGFSPVSFIELKTNNEKFKTQHDNKTDNQNVLQVQK